ncbi:MAG: hypothetical protein ACN4G0_01910 [Polyangiales bacterium]
MYKSPMQGTRPNHAPAREAAHSFNTFELGRWTSSATIAAAMMATLLSACGDSGSGPGGDSGAGGNGGTGGSTTAAVCDQVFIVDLSQDGGSGDSCAKRADKESIASCVAGQIENALPEACTTSFDVFVPGTAAEHGAWKQFNAMFSRDTGRGYLSLQYRDSAVVEGLANVFDAASYDDGVIGATEALDALLYTLKTHYSEANVRVFGHSKGAHAVSLVADDAEFATMQFFAFAQPGRTSVDISSRDDIRAGRRGNPGFIEKLSANLVGITWVNDEVQFYTGNGTNGLQMPERWSYPGFIWQDTFNGANPLSFRIDHHNNYGGTYTDGLSGNEWREGEGTVEELYPYCATGDSFFGGETECEKQTVRYVPYFWGDEVCRSAAFEIMNDGVVGDGQYIGFSGPRGPDCTEETGTITADYEFVYRINIGDFQNGDCRYDMEVFLGGRGDRPDGGRFSVSTSQIADTGWLVKRGTIEVPPHMTIRVDASMTDTASGFNDCGGLSPAQSEGYIASLKLSFTHPGTGRRTERSVIGLGEGSTAFPWPVSLHMQNNVGWWESDTSDAWRIYYAPTFGALMVKGDTNGGVDGRFYKRVHLLD